MYVCMHILYVHKITCVYIYDHHIYICMYAIFVCYLCTKFERKLTRAKYTYILLLAAYSKMYFNIKTNH